VRIRKTSSFKRTRIDGVRFTTLYSKCLKEMALVIRLYALNPILNFLYVLLLYIIKFITRGAKIHVFVSIVLLFHHLSFSVTYVCKLSKLYEWSCICILFLCNRYWIYISTSRRLCIMLRFSIYFRKLSVLIQSIFIFKKYFYKIKQV